MPPRVQRNVNHLKFWRSMRRSRLPNLRTKMRRIRQGDQRTILFGLCNEVSASVIDGEKTFKKPSLPKVCENGRNDHKDHGYTNTDVCSSSYSSGSGLRLNDQKIEVYEFDSRLEFSKVSTTHVSHGLIRATPHGPDPLVLLNFLLLIGHHLTNQFLFVLLLRLLIARRWECFRVPFTLSVGETSCRAVDGLISVRG